MPRKKTKKLGRPKGINPHALRNQTSIRVRCAAAQKDRWFRAAQFAGKSLEQVSRELLDRHADECGV